MDAVATFLTDFAAWLLGSSLQGSVVIVLVLLVQWLFRRSLSPRWRFALWLLVLARFLLPVSLETSFSIFNLASVPAAKVFRAVGVVSNASAAKVEATKAPVPTAQATSAPAPTPPAAATIVDSGVPASARVVRLRADARRPRTSLR